MARCEIALFCEAMFTTKGSPEGGNRFSFHSGRKAKRQVVWVFPKGSKLREMRRRGESRAECGQNPSEGWR